MPLNKRTPDAFPDGDTFWQYMHLSKADWADIYADLYRQTHGEDASAALVMADAYRRQAILKAYRR